VRNPRSSSGAALLRQCPLSAALALIPAAALAQGVATEAQLQPISVTESRAQLDPNLPSSTASKTAEQLREQNIFNPEDAAALLPSTSIRKRYFGDRNSNVSGRSHGVLQPGRALVYLDGYLISNFLGRFDAPRWNMVNVEAIERIDALYGPFSAIYPGNSIGTTVVLTERKPKGFEASASVKYNHQGFDEYGTHESYGSKQLSARLASRLDSGLWYVLGVQHQDSQGHPMGYGNAVRGATSGAFGNGSLGTRVSGIQYDLDPQGRERAIFGATGADHSVQDTVNLRLGYDLSATQEIEGRISMWRSDSTVTNTTYLRDATANPSGAGWSTTGATASTSRPTPSHPASATNCTANWAPPGRRATPQAGTPRPCSPITRCCVTPIAKPACPSRRRTWAAQAR
jgi:iron complex outermembrane receptor protein